MAYNTRGIQYKGLTTGYFEEFADNEDSAQVIETVGCSCCVSRVKLTEAILQEAIKDAEAWLEELCGLVGTLPE